MQTSHKAIPNKTANLHTLAKRGTENTIQINPNYIYKKKDLPTFSTFFLSFFLIFLDCAIIHLSTKKEYLAPSGGLTSICSQTQNINCYTNGR